MRVDGGRREMEMEVPEFNERHGEAEVAEADAIRATARLPGFDIEIVHRRAVEGDAEQLLINLRAAPSFEAFGRMLEATNPVVAFWAQSLQLAWLPWFEVARTMAWPWALALPRPASDGTSLSAQRPAN